MKGEVGTSFDYFSSNTQENDPTQDLSLGSTTIIYLEKEIRELQYSISHAVKDESFKNLQALDSLQLHQVRSQLYISALLGSCLLGPNFTVEDIKKMVDLDFEKFNIFCQGCVSESPVANFREKIEFLFHIAESDIRDLALCGWSYRYGAFEECLYVLINKFYSKIIEEFTHFVESDELKVSDITIKFSNLFSFLLILTLFLFLLL